MAKKVRAGKSVQVNVATLEGGSDPSRGTDGNPVKARTTMTYQNITGAGHGVLSKGRSFNGILDGAQAVATCSITVADAVATTLTDSFTLGDYELIETVHWAVAEGDADATATALAAAINRLSGFSAEVNGDTANQVDVEGPVGPSKVDFKLTTRSGNLTVSPADGYMSHGDPSISPPTMT